MAELPDIRTQLLQGALDSYKSEAAEQAANWRDLDQKAQVTASMAGIFITGIIALTRFGNSNAAVIRSKYFLLAAIICFLFAFILCLGALLVRSSPKGPIGYNLDRMTRELLNGSRINYELPERFPRFLNDQLDIWHGVSGYMDRLLKRKAHFVFSAQILSLLAFVALSITGIMTLLT